MSPATFLALMLAAIDPQLVGIVGALCTGFVALHATSAGREKDLRAEVSTLNMRLLEVTAQLAQEKAMRTTAERERDECRRMHGS